MTPSLIVKLVFLAVLVAIVLFIVNQKKEKDDSES